MAQPYGNGTQAKRDPAADQLLSYSNQATTRTATASNGAPVDSVSASLSHGPRGPLLLQDFTLLDYVAAFDRERIPERVVHAKGAGAFGYFEVTHDITKYTKAKLFESIGKRTPIAFRGSTVGGESGSADTARDPRGFSVKFYTEEGNWDMVGNNTPIFFVRDPLLFPSFIHTQKRNPATHLKDPDMFWDFLSLRPESMHQVAFLFSERGTPNGFRHMHGYSSHAFKFINGEDKAIYVKFHFRTNQGIKNLSTEEANDLAGSDPDYATRDLYNAIARGNHPSWTLHVQLMTEEQAEKNPFNPFDVTKTWSQKEFPLHQVGKIVLDRNPKNYFAEVEQLAFAPSHLVPGIEPSPDKMLQGRLFSYSDTQRYRLGVNYQQIPVNCPYARVQNYQRDGAGRVNDNQAGAPNYFPNSFSGPQPSSTIPHHVWAGKGDIDRYETKEEDNTSQVTVFWTKVLNESGREKLVTNMGTHLAGAQEFIRQRTIDNYSKVHPDFGRRLAEKVAAEVEKQKKAAVKNEQNWSSTEIDAAISQLGFETTAE